MESFVEGWTAPVLYQLLKNGLSFDATGMTVELILRSHAGVEVAEVGPCAWSDASQSIVQYTPAAADLLRANSPLSARFKVTAGLQVAYFPRSDGEEWVVHRT